MYDGSSMTLVEWAAKLTNGEGSYLDIVGKTVPGTEDGLKAMKKAIPDPHRSSVSNETAERIKNILAPHVTRVIEALKLAGVEKDLGIDNNNDHVTATYNR